METTEIQKAEKYKNGVCCCSCICKRPECIQIFTHWTRIDDNRRSVFNRFLVIQQQKWILQKQEMIAVT